MRIQVDELERTQEALYAALCRELHSLIYPTIRYRGFLRRVVGGEDHYLIAKEGGEVVGALPLFLKRSMTIGCVVNSLPFHGSNGGVLISPRARDPESVFRHLVDAAEDLARQADARTLTLITSPFDPAVRRYEARFPSAFRDWRHGQILPLSGSEEALMARMHPSRRRGLGIARRKGVSIRRSADPVDLQLVVSIHMDNMAAVGARAKEWHVFDALRMTLQWEKDYVVYVAEVDGRLVGGLIVLFHDITAEYFVPALNRDDRSTQAGSALVFEAIRDARRRGCRYLNFGGPREGQQGVYDFKKRWGAIDMPYFYFSQPIYDATDLLSMDRTILEREWPYFYAVPFEEQAAS
jgi:CelD/BcsL family acetyltransferase involved in cellulose biosynthesis